MVALVVFRRGDDELLLVEGYDPVRKLRYLRPPGGGVDFGELSADAARREVREELGVDIVDVEQLGILEAIFVNEGQPEHQIVFVYGARFADESLFAREAWDAQESDGEAMKVEWCAVGNLGAETILVPSGLDDLLGLVGQPKSRKR